MVIMKHDQFDNYPDLVKLRLDLGRLIVTFIQCLPDIISIFFVGIY